MKLLLSVKPEYSKKILSGEKKYEFRKQKPKRMIDVVFIYESSPTKNIVGGFSVKKIHSGSPKRIWRKCKDSSGIELSNYLEYCNGAEVVHAFEIEETFKFDNPVDPFATISNFRPPQSFSYLHGSVMRRTLKNSQDHVARFGQSHCKFGGV